MRRGILILACTRSFYCFVVLFYLQYIHTEKLEGSKITDRCFRCVVVRRSRGSIGAHLYSRKSLTESHPVQKSPTQSLRWGWKSNPKSYVTGSDCMPEVMSLMGRKTTKSLTGLMVSISSKSTISGGNKNCLNNGV